MLIRVFLDSVKIYTYDSANGEISLAASYNPWGSTLSLTGTGKFMQGYFGGIMDTATGLIGLYPEFIEGWATANIMTRKPGAS